MSLRPCVAVLVASACVLTGCDALRAKVAREDISEATLAFVPYYMVANVEYWFYEFDTSGSQVIACNSNDNFYTASGWSIDEDTSTVTVFFGSGWEEYELIPNDDSLEEGHFFYDNSNGDQEMEGDWIRSSAKPCSYLTD